jgi:4-alpha-glucanotransferase
LTVGCSRRDVWHFGSVFLDGYRLGAPPSRTNREGQPWGYPVLDPSQYRRADGSLGPALQLLGWRAAKTFREYDRLRIDHPHGLVCPWVYRADAPDPFEAVRGGARLFSSPDLEDHPRLARFSHVGPAQIRRDRPRHADDWIDQLSAEQVRAFGQAFEVVADQAQRTGGVDRLICEVLSTQPRELQSVLESHGLGRFRVTQKARPWDASDVYRTDRARPEDWVLMGNHDTPSIWSAIRRWTVDGTRMARAEYLAARLAPRPTDRETLTRTLVADDFELAHAELADLFLSRSRNVMLSFIDLFGFPQAYNTPGTIGDHNWSLRLPRDHRARYAALLQRRQAISVEKSLRIALHAAHDEPL